MARMKPIVFTIEGLDELRDLVERLEAAVAALPDSLKPKHCRLCDAFLPRDHVGDLVCAGCEDIAPC